ncbi:cystatin domain-containing protein [Sphingomonas canadensis]|uniref:Cystatin domain-containing protein n=1 Tax=Sphingomonas canadensis TaxID=1219257 RepID=A0ABW3H1X1_9SPHN|nr:cystatin domain-containing protein [Sphingomonas canadensis]MCW3834629.1 cystatin domain-containing protein [Sphingomonas canadensis]
MKKLALAAAAFGAACLLAPSAASAQTIPGKPVPSVGGWKPQDKITPDIEAAAIWAFNQLDVPGAELAEIVDVYTQVVAGTNYRMTLVFTDGNLWEVVVYRKWDGAYTLTSSQEK